MWLKGFIFVLFLLILWLTRFILLLVSLMFLINQLVSSLIQQTAQVIHDNTPYFSVPEAIAGYDSWEKNQPNFHYVSLKFQTSTFTGMNNLNQHLNHINFPPSYSQSITGNIKI